MSILLAGTLTLVTVPKGLLRLLVEQPPHTPTPYCQAVPSRAQGNRARIQAHGLLGGEARMTLRDYCLQYLPQGSCFQPKILFIRGMPLDYIQPKPVFQVARTHLSLPCYSGILFQSQKCLGLDINNLVLLVLAPSIWETPVKMHMVPGHLHLLVQGAEKFLQGLRGIAPGLFIWSGSGRARAKWLKEGRDFSPAGLEKSPEASVLTSLDSLVGANFCVSHLPWIFQSGHSLLICQILHWTISF